MTPEEWRIASRDPVAPLPSAGSRRQPEPVKKGVHAKKASRRKRARFSQAEPVSGAFVWGILSFLAAGLCAGRVPDRRMAEMTGGR